MTSTDGIFADRRGREAKVYARETARWTTQGAPSLDPYAIRQHLLQAAALRPSDVALDLSAGTGFITLPLALIAHHVTSVDISASRLQALERSAGRKGLTNIRTLRGDIARLEGTAHCADLIVSSNALHRLTREQKLLLLHKAPQWLRPGGRIVIEEVMDGRSSSDRQDQTTVGVASRRSSWQRLIAHLTPYRRSVSPRGPEPADFWTARLRAGGFTDVSHASLAGGIGLVVGTVPSAVAMRAPKGITPPV